MIRLAALYGVGDAYLVCSLARAFETHHGLRPIVVLKSAQAVVAKLFGLDAETNDLLVTRAESDQQLQRVYENIFHDGALLYVHPHFVRSGARIDQLTVKPRVSQADMYRALLRLPPEVPMERPRWWPAARAADVLLITESRSWPSLPATFWPALERRLRDAGRRPVANDPTRPLEELLGLSAGAAWVIGPQCGVMSILCESGLACQKTLAIRKLGPDCRYLFGLAETMPYGHVSTFAGNDHDVRHVIVGSDVEGAIADVLFSWGGP